MLSSKVGDTKVSSRSRRLKSNEESDSPSQSQLASSDSGTAALATAVTYFDFRASAKNIAVSLASPLDLRILQPALLNTIVFNLMLPHMDKNDLTREQIEKMQAVIAPTSQYLRRVVERMLETGFPVDDTIRQSAERSQDALHTLWIHLHYLKCKDQTGSPFQQRPRKTD